MQKKCVLLVEDDAPVRLMIRDALEMRYKVIVASTYSEATEQSKNDVDLAIIDYSLPDGNGLELSKVIRKDKPMLPVIIMTAYGSEALATDAIWAGVTGYIKKPFKLAHLMVRISAIFGEQEHGAMDESGTLATRGDFIMEGIAVHIGNRYPENLTLDKLADMAQMSKSHFCRMFRKRFGVNFSLYINRVRVAEAALLLAKSYLNISEIAASVGFEYVQHFNRIFREVYGISPGEYRRTHRNK